MNSSRFSGSALRCPPNQGPGHRLPTPTGQPPIHGIEKTRGHPTAIRVMADALSSSKRSSLATSCQS